MSSRLTSNGPLGSSRSTSGSQMNQGLMVRIMEKQGELERLTQLRDHTANLASQLEVLEGKLTTLTDGTESVASILTYWNDVFRAISLATRELSFTAESSGEVDESADLPETLVRMPLTQSSATSL